MDNVLTRPFAFLSSWRSLPPYELLSYVFMYASVPLLAYGLNVYSIEMVTVVIFTVITLYSGFFAVIIMAIIVSIRPMGNIYCPLAIMFPIKKAMNANPKNKISMDILSLLI